MGELDLDGGYYVYTGSARRGLEARVERHRRRDTRRKRWHVDHLAAACRFVAAFAYPGSFGECALAAAGGGLVIPRFGASDCRCPGHLSYFRERPDLPLPGGVLIGENDG